MLGRGTKRHCNIVGDLIAGNRNHRRVPYRTIGKHRNVGGAGTDINQTHTQLFFVVTKHGLAGGQRPQDHRVGIQAAARDTAFDVLHRALRTGHHVNSRLQAHAAHANRVTHPFLIVDDKFLRDDVQHLLIRRQRHRARGLHDLVHIGLGDLAAIAHRNHAMRVLTPYMAGGDSGKHPVDFAIRHQLGLFDRTLNRLNGGLDVDHHALFQSERGMRAHRDDLETPVLAYLANQRRNLGCPHIQRYDQVLVALLHHLFSLWFM